MKASTMALASALVGSVAMSAVAVAQTGPAPKPEYKFEKCYGVVKAGKNDCQTMGSSCAGTSKRDASTIPGSTFRPAPATSSSAAAWNRRSRNPGRVGATIMARSVTCPVQGRTGIGFRAPHFAEIVATRPAVGFLEVHAENYMGGGPALRQLETLRLDWPIGLHGVGMSLGSAGGLDDEHLERFAALVERIEPSAISEHLAWSVTAKGTYLNDLLPLPLYRGKPGDRRCQRQPAARPSRATGADREPVRVFALRSLHYSRSAVPHANSSDAPAAVCCSTSTTST